MQAVRFGVFSSAQKAQLGQISNGKSLRQAVLDSLKPLSTREAQDFDDMTQDIKNDLAYGLVQVDAAGLEKELGTQDLDDIINGSFAKDLANELAQIKDPATKREFLISEVAATFTGIVESLQNWSHKPSDKVFEALVKSLEAVKNTLKF